MYISVLTTAQSENSRAKVNERPINQIKNKFGDNSIRRDMVRI